MKRATNIQPLRETVVITNIKDKFEIISKDDKFKEEVNSNLELQFGSSIEFHTVFNSRTKTMNAYDIKPLPSSKKRSAKPAILITSQTEGTVFGKSGVVILRQPIPGDGTRGFISVGRGKLLLEDRDRLVTNYFQTTTGFE